MATSIQEFRKELVLDMMKNTKLQVRQCAKYCKMRELSDVGIAADEVIEELNEEGWEQYIER